MRQINSARAQAGVPPLAPDALLERVGDLHCETLLSEGGQGHFSRSGVPPYVRYLLAGGNGFHMENAASYSSSAAVGEGGLGAILAQSVASMLAESPPDDGHRRALLDRNLTHIGVGIAVRGGEVRMTHELATEAATRWSPPAIIARPGSAAVLTGALARPWRPVGVEVLRAPLPRPLSDAEARAIRSYAYPAPRLRFTASRSASGGNSVAAFRVDGFGNFDVRWATGARDGIEIAVVFATRGDRSEPVPVAAAATVVTRTGVLPPDLAPWRRLAVPGAPR